MAAKQKGIVLSADEINRLRDGKPGMIWRTADIQPPDARQWRVSTLVDSTARDDRKHIGKLQWVIVEGLNILERDSQHFTLLFEVGDKFYVKEAWQVRDDRGYYTKVDTKFHPISNPECARIWERSQPPSLTQLWIPAAQMPQWASRFILIVQAVVFKRLQDVTEEEARLSGKWFTMQHDSHPNINGFRESWDATHKKGNRWADNCWQWGATVTMEGAK